jgi:FkbM family methyltransferase
MKSHVRSKKPPTVDPRKRTRATAASERSGAAAKRRFPNAVGSDQTEAPICFLHIPKTGGATLTEFLQTLFTDAEFWHRGGGRTCQDLLKLTPEQLQQSQIINGYFGGYFYKHYPLPLRYFTFLRDPLTRAISHYEYVCRTESHYFHALAHELGSFGAYLRDERTQPTIVNFQLRSIGATFDAPRIARTLTAAELEQHELERRLDTMPLGVSLDKLLQVSQGRLDQMCFVGLTERFDESVGLLCEVFGWPRPATLEPRNVNPRATSVKDLPSGDLRLLRRLNEADIELYQLATDRFERDWARSRFVYPRLHAFVSYAQNAEDVLLYRALKDVREGVYVDVGANDPAGDSVTKAFYDRGWHGINIEPVTSLYEGLVKQRPRDINIHAAAGAATAHKTLYEIPGTGLSTLDARIADRHRKQGFKVNETRVRVRTLRSILAEAPQSSIHFLKIDVEGWERDVLRGIDLAETRPWIVVVEATKPNTEVPSHGEWESLLLGQGYLFAFFDGLNRYYLARERRALMKAFSRPVNSGDVFVKSSEAAAVGALRDTQWSLRRQNVLLRERDAETRRHVEALTQWATSSEVYAKSLVSECDGLRASVKSINDAREVERVEAVRQIEALTQWATSSETYAKSLLSECEKQRSFLKTVSDTREVERLEATRQIEALTQAREVGRLEAIRQIEALTERATSSENYATSLLREVESLRASLKDVNDAREGERVEALRQIEILTEQTTSLGESCKSLLGEGERLRAALTAAEEAREAERTDADRRNEALTESMTSAAAYAKSLASERDALRASMEAAGGALEQLQATLEREREAGERERASAADRADQLKAHILGLEKEIAVGAALEAELRASLERERYEREIADAGWSNERKGLEADVQRLTERLQRAEGRIRDLSAERNALQDAHGSSIARLEAERSALVNSVMALNDTLSEVGRHWAVRLLVNKRYLPRPDSGEGRRKRKTGIFTIASKNYLAYVRVLFKSIAAVHPEYELYLCLADKVGGAFDPDAEVFRVVESDRIGIPHFEDMTVRYDIMEFNTAIKPFMFRWLLDNTELDSVIYLDPDIRVYSRFDRLEAVLESGISVALIPHITRPVEDGKNPNDYNMLQSGVFNLGFAAINRCDEARGFVEWWGRRLETQGSVDIAHNLFTDQRWCDLAPCFVDRLHVFKSPGYNVAYWNLTERTIWHANGEWQANGEPLVFFHFSGINAADESVVSKHQNRFDFATLPACKPLFDAYRAALHKEGWEQTKGWPYVYGRTKEGLPMPTIVRQLFREAFPVPQSFIGTSATEKVLELCNESSKSVHFDAGKPVTRLMDTIYRQRPDLQAAFNLGTRAGRDGFLGWYESAAFREYKIPPELIPQSSTIEAEAEPVAAAEGIEGSVRAGSAATHAADVIVGLGISDEWDRVPVSVKRLMARAMTRLSSVAGSNNAHGVIVRDHPGEGSGGKMAIAGRIASLEERAPLPQLLEERYISNLMHLIWNARPDLQQAFDLNTRAGQSGYASWFEASAQREYGPGACLPVPIAANNGLGDGSTLTRSTTPLRPGANLIGYATAELGMGEHLRMCAAAMQSTSVAFGVVNFKVGLSVRQEATFEHGEVITDNPFSANVFNVNADQMLVAYCHLGGDFFARRYNIGYWTWELARCPPQFLPAMNMVDEVWAGSRFVQEAFAEKANVPVEYMPECVELPTFERLDRGHFSLPDRAFVFVYTFDFLSYVDRKNPFAAIRAFKLAFPNRRADVRLVLKAMNGNEKSELWMKMMELIDRDQRISVINRTTTRAEVLALIDMSDCFVSLHRSEGFGRGPAEAMYLGKPVIVTNYSGNTDFTLSDNSCLVDFNLVKVEEGQYPFHAGQQWADPNIENAAWYMKRLHEDESYARGVGVRGRAYIRENFSRQAIGARYEARLKKLGLS